VTRSPRGFDEVPRRHERVPVDAADFERIRANLDRGVEAWVSTVVHDADRVLLVRNRWSDGWIPPGGSVEPGEDPAAAAAREVREETGVDCAVEAPVAVVEETFVHDGRTVAGPRVAFAAHAATTALAEDPGLDGEGIEAVDWFDALPDRMEQRWLVETARERRG
jgi:8-oxo-dGTP pyrophosphatase MutT (NUDIX family)